MDPMTQFVQNSTVIDLENGGSETIAILAPPRTESMLFMIGESGRENWPVRNQEESWTTWFGNGGSDGNGPDAIVRVVAENTTFDTVNTSADTGGAVGIKTVNIQRAMDIGIEQGGAHSTGLLHGRTVYDRLYEITDPANTFDLVDGKAGYYDRWAGQGNPAYEDAAQYLIQELSSFGLEVRQHRYEFTDIFQVQNPEAYNICAYKWGSEAVNEWLVFGAHFDVAPPANAVLLDPVSYTHLTLPTTPYV